MKKIEFVLNLTGSNSTEEQINNGIVDPYNMKSVRELLTIDHELTEDEIEFRAWELAQIADDERIPNVLIKKDSIISSDLACFLKAFSMKSILV